MKNFVIMIAVCLLAILGCSPEQKEIVSDSIFKAKVVRVEGQTMIFKQTTDELPNVIPATMGDILGQKDEIVTQNGTTDVKIVGIGILKVKKYSRFELSSLTSNIRLKLNKGKVLLALNKLRKDTTLDIETPTAVAGVRGTSFLVDVSSKDVSKIAVLTGSIKIPLGNRGFLIVKELEEMKIAKKWKSTSKMNIDTIIDVKGILKIKGIESVEGFKKIKRNIKRLEIIEASEIESKIDIEALKNKIKAKELKTEDDSINLIHEELKKEDAEINDSEIDAKKKKFIDDSDF